MVIRFNNTLVEYFDISCMFDPKTDILIPRDKIDSYKHPMFMTKSGVFKYFASVLIRNCADKIFLIDYSSSKPSDSRIYNDFPEGLKDHIKIINKNRSNVNKIIKYLEPVSLDLNDINDKQKIYQIAHFFDKITLGSKYKAEVEINNYEKIGNIFNELNKKISDDEALFRLNAFNGIYNLYSNIGDIDTISLKATQYKGSIEKRVKYLMLEADIRDCSKNRHLLGIPIYYKKSKLKIKDLIGKISKNPSTYKFVNYSKDTILTSYGIPPKVTPNIPDLSDYCNKTYNPPLISLDKFRRDTIRTIFKDAERYLYTVHYLPDFKYGSEKPIPTMEFKDV